MLQVASRALPDSPSFSSVYGVGDEHRNTSDPRGGGCTIPAPDEARAARAQIRESPLAIFLFIFRSYRP